MTKREIESLCRVLDNLIRGLTTAGHDAMRVYHQSAAMLLSLRRRGYVQLQPKCEDELRRLENYLIGIAGNPGMWIPSNRIQGQLPMDDML
jgi:hypothetical protein